MSCKKALSEKIHKIYKETSVPGSLFNKIAKLFFFFFDWDSCKAEQTLRGMELQEKEARKD